MIENEKNKGFTLIELIIAIAMLAFLMTAVCSFMTSGVASYKKAKADMRVHNSAQDNYDKISDAFMEAKNIYLYGYEEGNTDNLYWYVRDEEQKQTLINDVDLEDGFGLKGLEAEESNIRLFSTLQDSDTYKKVYAKAIVVDTSTPIVESNLYSAIGETSGYDNKLTSDTEGLEIKVVQHEIVKKEETTEVQPDGTVSTVVSTSTEIADVEREDSGEKVYNTNDTIRQVFIFDDNCMYYMTKYAYGTKADDNIITAAAAAGVAPEYADLSDDADESVKSAVAIALSPYTYSSSFGITDSGITDCVVCVAASDNSLSVEMGYSDKNMTYTTNGMIRVRNSNVVKARKTQESENNTEEGTE